MSAVNTEKPTQITVPQLSEANKLTFKLPPVERTGKREWVLEPKQENGFDGWFRRGSLSIIGAPSGAGKSTFTLDLLCEQREGREYMGHQPGGKYAFFAVFADRPEDDVKQTLERLNLVGKVKGKHLTARSTVAAVQAIVQMLEAEPELPQILFIEGADMLAGDTADAQSVGLLLTLLQSVAEHYYLAVIMSVGAPKAKKGDEYQLKRDRIIGSQVWGRMSSTIVTMDIKDEGLRNVDVLHRDAAHEHFELMFENGKLVLAPPEETAADPLWEWVIEQTSWFTRQDAINAMEGADNGIKKSAVNNRLTAWVDGKKLDVRTGLRGKQELRLSRNRELDEKTLQNVQPWIRPLQAEEESVQ